jgi:hypothetical protein
MSVLLLEMDIQDGQWTYNMDMDEQQAVNMGREMGIQH